MRASAILFLAQRASALVLAPLVLIHLGLAIYAIHGGLTAAEILGRTQGSLGWTLFYGLFVVAAAIHAPIGLDIRAETPAEISVSIMAEVIQVRAERRGSLKKN